MLVYFCKEKCQINALEGAGFNEYIQNIQKLSPHVNFVAFLENLDFENDVDK